MTSSVDRRRFLVLGNREVGLADHIVVCRVQLFCNDDPFWGEARDIDSDLGRTRAAARATLAAAEDAVRHVRLALEGAHTVRLFGRLHVVVSIEAVAGRRFVRLTGIAPAEPSLEDASCAATLDAVERWLTS